MPCEFFRRSAPDSPRSRRRATAAALLLAASTGAQWASAQTFLTWTFNGNGTWNTASNWTAGAVPNADPEVAVFAGTNPVGGFTVTINNTVSPRAVRFNSTATNPITINSTGSGTFLSLAPAVSGVDTIFVDAASGDHIVNANVRLAGVNGHSFNIGEGRTFTINGTLLGDLDDVRDLTKTGDGVLVLAGAAPAAANDLSDVILSAGTLRFGSDTAIQNASLTINSGAVEAGGAGRTINSNLTIGGNFAFSGLHSLTFSGATSIGSSVRTITVGGSAGTVFALDGTISDSDTGGITKAGSGTLYLSNTNHGYSGATTVAGGILQVDSLENGGVNSSIGDSTSAAANLVLQGGGVLRKIGANNTTDRNYTLGAGGGGFDVGAALNLTISGSMTATGTGDRTLSLNAVSGGAGTLGGTIGNAGVGSVTSVTKTGAGTWSLTNAGNTYTGRTTVNGGGLNIATVANEGANSSIGVASDAAARVSGVAPLPNLVLDGSTLRYTGAGHSTNRHFALGAGGGTIDASGTGPLTFSQWWTVAHTGSEAAKTLTLTGSNTGANTLGLVLKDYDFGAPDGSLGFGEPLSLTKTGAGTWVIPATVANQPSGDVFQNYHTGPTQILGGVLQVGKLANGGSPSHIGASSSVPENLIIDDATLRYVYPGATDIFAHDAGQVNRRFTIGNGTATIDVSRPGVGLGGPLNLYDNSPLSFTGSGNRTLVLTGDFADFAEGTNDYNAIRAIIGDPGGGGVTTLRKQGSGEWVLTGQNTYTGSTFVEGGILLLAHGDLNEIQTNENPLPPTTSVIISPGAELELYTGDAGESVRSTPHLFEPLTQTVASLTGSGFLTINGGTFIVNNTGGITYNGIIRENADGGSTEDQILGTFGKSGSGALTLTSTTNNYTGPTLITGGTLTITSVANAGVVSTLGAATADPGNLLLNGGALRYLGSGHSTNRGFTIGLGGGTFDADGAGALAITGAMAASGSGARIIALTGGNTGDNTLGAAIFDNGGVTSLAKYGSGKWVLTGGNTYSGITNLTSGTLQIGNGGVTGSLGTGNVTTNSATLALNRSDSVTVDNLISGSGNFLKLGGGVVTLTASNTYTGATVISSGVLEVSTLANGGSPSNIGQAGTPAPNLLINGGTLRYVGAGSSTDRLLSLANGGGTIEASGTGSVNFSSTNTLPAPIGNSVLTLGGTSTADNTFALDIQDATSGMTSVTKTGPGKWILTANSDYLSSTTINGGTLQVNAVAPGSTNSPIGESTAAPANLVLNGGALRYSGTVPGGHSTDRAFTLGASGGILDASNTAGGALNFSSALAVTLTGTNTARTLTLTGSNAANNTLGAVIPDNGTGATSLTKAGAGKWVLSASHTYSGSTTISGGTLALVGTGNNRIASSPLISLSASDSVLDVTGLSSGSFNLAAGQTLRGIGRVQGGVAAGGANSAVEAGNSVGTLTVQGNFNLSSATSNLGITVDIGNIDASVLVVNGTVALTGNLKFTFVAPVLGPVPSDRNTYVIVRNDLVDAITGTFAGGTPTGVDDELFNFGPLQYVIDYNFAGTDDRGILGDGNDIAVTFSSVPEPSSLAAALLTGAWLLRRRRVG